MFKRLLILPLFLLTLAAGAQAAQLTGTIRPPNSSAALVNGTLQFVINQAGVVPGVANITQDPVYCYTSTNGQVVGIPNPPASIMTGALSLVTEATTLPAGAYYIRVTWFDSNTSHETLPSVSGVAVVNGAQTVHISPSAALPTGATGYRVYASLTQGSETLQATVVGINSYTLTSLVTGAAQPAVNSTQCSTIAFNDTIIPTDTTYQVSITTSTGARVAGFPQEWYLSGSSLDVSSVYPMAGVARKVRFPSPLLLNPSSNAQQSVNSPVTLNGYSLTAGSLILPNNLFPPVTRVGQTALYTNSSGALFICPNGAACAGISTSANGWTDSGNTVLLQSLTDLALTGLTSTDLAGTVVGNGSVVAGGSLYAVSGTTNARSAFLSAGVYGSAASLTSGVTGAQTTGWPLAFRVCPSAGDCSMVGTVEVGRFDLNGQLLLGLTGSDAAASSIIASGNITLATAAANASTLTLSVAGGAATIKSGHTNSGTDLPLAFYVIGGEAARLDVSGNWLVGTTAADDTTQAAIETARSQNTGLWALVRNASTGTAAYAATRTVSGASNSTIDLATGVTSSGFTPGLGLLASNAFIKSGAGASGGMTLQSSAGTIKLQPGGGNTELTATASTGITLAHALPVTSGGTGNTSAWTSTGILYASSTSATATSSKHKWDDTNGIESVTGGIALASATRNNPAGGTSYLHMFYDSSTPSAIIVAVDYTGPAYKHLTIGSDQLTFDAAGTSAFYIINSGGYVGPKWAFSTNASAGGTSLSLASTTFPGSVGGIPYTWLKVEAADGTVVWVPAFK